MQEESSIRKEQARRATEQQIQAQQRQTEKERAEIERETIRVKAMAEAEGRAHEAKLTEDHNRRMLLERINGERDKWLAAINTTFSHIEGLSLPYCLNCSFFIVVFLFQIIPPNNLIASISSEFKFPFKAISLFNIQFSWLYLLFGSLCIFSMFLKVSNIFDVVSSLNI